VSRVPAPLLWLVLAVLSTACAQLPLGHPRDLPVDRDDALPPIAEAELPHSSPGSLWRGDASRRFLAFENRARRTGDLITVQIQERAQAASEATTDLQRKSSFQSNLDSDLSLQTLVTRPILRVLGILGFTSQTPSSNPTADVKIVEASTNTKFEGDGSVERESTLRTTIACLITETTPSGLLRIEGKRYITINHETQVIRIAGYVRPEDVQIDNTITSSLIANATIEYGGKGVVSDKQRVPWFTRFLEFFLPF
jgi:flagellar L-ring protein precursor FlgH